MKDTDRNYVTKYLIDVLNERVRNKSEDHTPEANKNLVLEFIELNLTLVAEAVEDAKDGEDISPWVLDKNLVPHLLKHVKGRVGGPGVEALY